VRLRCPGRAAVVVGALALCSLPYAAAAGARSKPLLEVGLVGGGYLPDYPVSDESHFRARALSFVAYRGKFLRSDEKGLLRGRILSAERLELDVSLTGSFPADADDNEARRGMPDLDWLGEIGLQLQITIARAGRDAKHEIELPVHAVFSTDLSAHDYRGLVFAPQLAYQHDEFLRRGLEFKLSGGPSFATRELMDLLYEVEARFATPARAAFAARPGHLGTALQLRRCMRSTSAPGRSSSRGPIRTMARSTRTVPVPRRPDRKHRYRCDLVLRNGGSVNRRSRDLARTLTYALRP